MIHRTGFRPKSLLYFSDEKESLRDIIDAVKRGAELEDAIESTKAGKRIRIPKRRLGEDEDGKSSSEDKENDQV